MGDEKVPSELRQEDVIGAPNWQWPIANHSETSEPQEPQEPQACMWPMKPPPAACDAQNGPDWDQGRRCASMHRWRYSWQQESQSGSVGGGSQGSSRKTINPNLA